MSNEMNFENAINKLEGAVNALESGELTLDESISEFEEAVMLIEICRKRLDEAERKVKILTKSSDGSVYDLPFDADGNEA